jgi:hypothetical protein
MNAQPLSRAAFGIIILAALIASLVAWRDGSFLYFIGAQ